MKKSIMFCLVVFIITMAGASASAWTLIWIPATDGGAADGYIVDISTDGGSTWPYHYSVTQTELPLDDKCGYNIAYDFRVSSYNSAGVSAPTAPLSWTRPGYAPPPDSPLPPIGTPPNAGDGLDVQ